MKEDKIRDFEDKLNINLNNKKLLKRALTHKSFCNEKTELNLKNNERLEFLGDSVLSLTISSYIFREFPQYSEGKLAKMRSIIVSAPVLSEIAAEFELGEYILMGHGEEKTGGRTRDSILADSLEAVLGAIYLDKGIDEVSDIIIDIFHNIIDEVSSETYIRDYKTRLQEITQEEKARRPEYRVVNDRGPDHNKTFVVEVSFGDTILGKGEGSTIKEAEQKAAKIAYENIDVL